jgi:hypothetical protein
MTCVEAASLRDLQLKMIEFPGAPNERWAANPRFVRYPPIVLPKKYDSANPSVFVSTIFRAPWLSSLPCQNAERVLNSFRNA